MISTVGIDKGKDFEGIFVNIYEIIIKIYGIIKSLNTFSVCLMSLLHMSLQEIVLIDSVP